MQIYSCPYCPNCVYGAINLNGICNQYLLFIHFLRLRNVAVLIFLSLNTQIIKGVTDTNFHFHLIWSARLQTVCFNHLNSSTLFVARESKWNYQLITKCCCSCISFIKKSNLRDHSPFFPNYNEKGTADQIHYILEINNSQTPPSFTFIGS